MGIHIIQDGGDAATDVFNAACQGRQIDIVIVNFGQCLADRAIQPVEQQLVAADAFKIVLEEVGMGIDKAGENELILPIDDAVGVVVCQGSSGLGEASCDQLSAFSNPWPKKLSGSS